MERIRRVTAGALGGGHCWDLVGCRFVVRLWRSMMVGQWYSQWVWVQVLLRSCRQRSRRNLVHVTSTMNVLADDSMAAATMVPVGAGDVMMVPDGAGTGGATASSGQGGALVASDGNDGGTSSRGSYSRPTFPPPLGGWSTSLLTQRDLPLLHRREHWDREQSTQPSGWDILFLPIRPLPSRTVFHFGLLYAR